jgi:hypothetical protein
MESDWPWSWGGRGGVGEGWWGEGAAQVESLRSTGQVRRVAAWGGRQGGLITFRRRRRLSRAPRPLGSSHGLASPASAPKHPPNSPTSNSLTSV